jgi:hypothetical protein
VEFNHSGATSAVSTVVGGGGVLLNALYVILKGDFGNNAIQKFESFKKRTSY